MFVGARRDPEVGPVVVLGWGGVDVGLLTDPVVAAAPVTREHARDMVRRLRGHELLHGYRGAAAGDVEGLVRVIQAVSRAVDADPRIAELDINPLFVGRHGAVAADALVVLTQDELHPGPNVRPDCPARHTDQGRRA